MNPCSDSNSTTLNIRSYRTRLVQGLGWIGALGLLSSSTVLAQASAPPTADEPAIQPVNRAAALESPPVPTAPAAEPLAGSAPGTVPGAEPGTATNPAIAPNPSPVDDAVPKVVIPPSPSLVPPQTATEFNEPYIDTTQYTIGATRREDPTTKPAIPPSVGTLAQEQTVPSAAPVTVGPLSLSASGIGVGTTPSVRDYYNRTLRPPGLLGNGNIRLIFPLTIPAPITSLFGWRIHPITGDSRFHSGTDLGAPLGTPVLAAYAGKVAIADFLGGYGLAVMLEHNKGTQETLYGHLSEIFVRPGEWVAQGTVIGRVGSTGNSTGPHLHFEFRQMTSQGWVALDAGAQLEYAMAQMMNTLANAQLQARFGM